jgi:hypothetical protein
MGSSGVRQVGPIGQTKICAINSMVIDHSSGLQSEWDQVDLFAQHTRITHQGPFAVCAQDCKPIVGEIRAGKGAPVDEDDLQGAGMGVEIHKLMFNRKVTIT